MLDALSDFWKPMKKAQTEKLRTEFFQVGSAIVFGFVPQASLSGMRLQVSAINTYQFGSESLTSFVLSNDRVSGVSMIVAESDGEQYLAISRRISISDRIKMFDNQELENVTEKQDVIQLTCKDNPDFKGWTVPTYRRQIQGMKGILHGGDFRKASLPANGQEFKYTLLASSSNENAIEIEKYPDGRVEMYATVYRRTSDIGEVSHPMRPDVKLASGKVEEKSSALANEKPLPSLQGSKAENQSVANVVKSAPIKLQEFVPPPVEAKVPEVKPVTKVEVKAEALPPVKAEVEKPAAPAVVAAPLVQPESIIPQQKQEKTTMSMTSLAANGAAPYAASTQEVKTMSKTVNGMENDAVECDLRVANKIIDEAIRNEMRLSDVVRRIIELPVAHQEAVHIPVTLSDEDFSLLAIRYGIPASDKNAIKRRIIDDLNSFSGAGKKAA